MKGIDENGRLFGVVNVIDAVGVVLLVALVVSAGAVFLSITSTDGGAETSPNASGNATGTGTQSVGQTTAVVDFQLLNDAPYVVDAIDEGPVLGSQNITAVLGTSRTTPVETGINGTTSNASVRLRLNITKRQTHVLLNDNRLYIGKRVRLDLGDVIVTGIVTEFEVEHPTTTSARTQT